MRSISFPFAALALAACATRPAAPVRSDGLAHLGEATRVGTLVVTPRAVVEDSRCPINARCVWAGRTRLSVRIDLGSGSETREIASDAPIQVADGQLALVEVQPDRTAGEQPREQKPYRFGFTFSGGL